MAAHSSFTAITSEGGLLPADFLAELLVPKTKGRTEDEPEAGRGETPAKTAAGGTQTRPAARGHSHIEGLAPVSYNLAEGERINEQVNRSWNRLKGRWTDFKKAIANKQPGEATTTETRERWLHPIFQELGFGQKLPAARALEIDGRTYPVSHGWSHVPIHLVGSHVDIDHRMPGAVGAAKASPHSLVQQVLNASDGHLWGLVSNGLTFRLLRDNIALTRMSYLEWDLAAIFDGDLYSEFFVLWLVAHQSRFDAERAEQCWLERWRKSAEDKGLRALEKLYPGVKRAIAALGSGLVSHRANGVLLEKLRSGQLTTQEFYKQVLRVIYRMLFLFVAEDRGLLHPPDESDGSLTARRRYLDFYSITRLRALTLYRAGTPHPDLWHVFQFITGKLGSDTGCPELALPPLGSFLWTAAQSTPDLLDSLISNRHFLEAIHALAFVQDGNVRRAVDYKNLGSEELGSVYQGLLEMHPRINADAGLFELDTAAGNERKTSGSYYTPDSLVQCLLDSALEPVIAERLAHCSGASMTAAANEPPTPPPCSGASMTAAANEPPMTPPCSGASMTADANEAPYHSHRRSQSAATAHPSRLDRQETALLNLKVCDMAVGSGHFLLRAAHRIARHLARVRSGEEEPSPAVYRTALRDVISHCLYGVDINPMAVELCKVTLWLEALEPGKPLSFLDHHIRCGNSLLGTTPELIAAGLPDATFDAIEGDDKSACASLRKINKLQREGLRHLFVREDNNIREQMLHAAAAIDEIGDDRPEHIHRKEAAFKSAQQNYDFQKARDLANLWCAAFVIKKRSRSVGVPPTSTIPSSSSQSQIPPPIEGQLLHTEEDLFGHSLPIPAPKRLLATSHPSLATPFGLTTQHLRDFVEDAPLPAGLLAEAKLLADQYQFFHFHLAFPEVFAQGGFDVSLGNPPWDTLSPDQREFFGKYVAGLRSMGPEEQQAEISRLLENPSIAAEWAVHCRELFALVHFLKSSGVYTLYAKGNLGKGDFNIYRMFVESALRRIRVGGFAAMVVSGGLYGGANASAIRQHLFDECELRHIFGLINTTRGWFEKVDIDRFAAFAAKRGGRTNRISTKFGLTGPEDLSRPAVEIEAEPIRQLAPETYAIPDLRNISELTTSRKMYAACPTFGEKTPGSPFRHYSAELHMGGNRDLFTDDPAGLPVYEGRMIDHFDHRAKTYQSGHGNSAVWIEREFGDPAKAIVPQWRVLRENIPGKLGDRCDRFRIGFGDVANPRNQRSFTATLIPPGVVCGDKVPTIDFGSENDWFFLPWLAVAKSFTMDWLARCRLTSPKMAFSLLDSLPFPRPALTDSFVQTVAPVVSRLACTAPEMTPFWNRMAALGFVEPVADDTVPPSALLDPTARAIACAELDAYVAARVFGLTAQELSDILDTFEAFRRSDERTHQEFRTKRLVLEAYLELQ
ncbi:MAG: hypothetical protein NTW21_02520 [Verrucomicrobia bacterium]|nr:hypothetical protein [Verrucomicrobiota bacterium]